MPCTCRECLELAARGANVELLRCAAQDVLPPTELGPSTGGPLPVETNVSSPCGIQRIQIVPFGLDEVSMSEFEDPNNRPYLWELNDGGHPSRHH